MANIYAMGPDAKQTIADAGLTQVELAERTGISRVMINKALHADQTYYEAERQRIEVGAAVRPGRARARPR